jgi:hypothetical protein
LPPPPTCATGSRRVCRDAACSVGCACRLLPCTGDCSGDGQVDIGEVIQFVGVALGSVSATRCPVPSLLPSIGDLVRAVKSALFGCSGPVTYRLLGGSTIVRTLMAGATPIIQPLTGSFTVIQSDIPAPNTWFELTVTALEFRAGDVVIGAGRNTTGCNATTGVGCLTSITFEFPPHSYASASVTIEGEGGLVGLNGVGALDPESDLLGFPELLHVELCGSAAEPFASCEAIRSGNEAGYALGLTASKGRFIE